MTTMYRLPRIPTPYEFEPVSRGAGAGLVPMIDERIRTLLRYWQSLRGDSAVPDRREFDPAGVAPVLRYFWILRRDTEAGCFRFVLAGEETLRLLGRKLVGMSIDEVFPEHAEQFNAAANVVLSKPAVLHMAGPMYWTDRAAVHAERLALPMGDGGTIDRIYGATVYRWPTPVQVGAVRFAGNVEATIVPVTGLGDRL